MSNRQYSASDGVISYFSSPTESFHGNQWNIMSHAANFGELVPGNMSERRFGCTSVPLPKEGYVAEGASIVAYNVDSSSSYSDAGDSEHSFMPHAPSHRNFSSRCFMSKPVYPITFVGNQQHGDAHMKSSFNNRQIVADGRNKSAWLDAGNDTEQKTFSALSDASTVQGTSDNGSSSQRFHFRQSSGSVLEQGWGSDSPELLYRTGGENSKLPFSPFEETKCALCERWLFQKSPWSSHRMVKNGDMPVAAVLCCSHVYHAECLEQATSKADKHDPPCPVCCGGPKLTVSSPGLHMAVGPVNQSRKIKVANDDGSGPSTSRNRGRHRSEYVADLLGRKRSSQIPQHSHKSFLSKSYLRKHFSFKGKSTKELPASEHGPRSTSSPLKVYPGDSIERFSVGQLSRGQNLSKW